MIARYENQSNARSKVADQPIQPNQDNAARVKQMGDLAVAQVKKLAVEKPVVVVAAGLAIGVLTGFILKRK